MFFASEVVHRFSCVWRDLRVAVKSGVVHDGKVFSVKPATKLCAARLMFSRVRCVRSCAMLTNDLRCALLEVWTVCWLLKFGVTDEAGSSPGSVIVRFFSSRKKLPSRSDTRAVSTGRLGFLSRSTVLVGAAKLALVMELG